MKFLKTVLLMIGFSSLTLGSGFASKDGCTLIRHPSKSTHVSLGNMMIGDLQCNKFDVPPFSIGVLIYTPTPENTADIKFIGSARVLLEQALPAKVHRFRHNRKEAILVGPSDFSVPTHFKVLDEISRPGGLRTKRRLEFIAIGQTLAELAAEKNPTDIEYLIDKFNQQMSDHQKGLFFEAMLDAIAKSLDSGNTGSTRFAYLLSQNWQRDTLLITHDVYSLLLSWGTRNRDLVRAFLEQK